MLDDGVCVSEKHNLRHLLRKAGDSQRADRMAHVWIYVAYRSLVDENLRNGMRQMRCRFVSAGLCGLEKGLTEDVRNGRHLERSADD